ncbi:Amidohydrolase family protein [Luminiphilus syltensis NOR5-1B]|uniref:Amidohydrolase family protein n=1 Tax=Luminiphilus syltensis NOR5-1B TaxID=565045 RepID=B8KX80_9GAMM|nr:Amidohydrolase family protein [Luminiphilus syltensis NOR5-1B]
MVITLLTGLLSLAGCGREDSSESVAVEAADLVLLNGFVYTVDTENSTAEAVAIDEGRIVFVGSNDGASAFIGEGTEQRDLGGQMVLPGLHDMHIHALAVVAPERCELQSKPLSLEAMVPVLEACIDRFEIAPGDWLVAGQWSFSAGNQPGADLPTIRAALDAVSRDHPIIIYGDDGHHAAANSAALARAAIPGGETVPISAESLATTYAGYAPYIEVDATGEPAGGIHESARGLLRPIWVDVLGLEGDLAERLQEIGPILAARGITTIQDPLVYANMLEAYAHYEASGTMPFRVRAAMMTPSAATLENIAPHIAELAEVRKRYADSDYIHADGVKLFADAVLEGNPLINPPSNPVAAVLDKFKQPIFSGSLEDDTFELTGYVDQESAECAVVQQSPEAYKSAEAAGRFFDKFGFYPKQCIPNSGVLEHSEDFIRQYISAATEAGFHVHVHALSDKAVRIAVDELASVKPIADRFGVSQSLAHLQLVHPQEQQRIGELGLATVFTFNWTGPFFPYEVSVRPFIDELDGLEDMYRPDGYYIENLYTARTLQDNGALIVHGSDAPVGGRDPVPFINLMYSLYRSDGDVVLNADERLDIESAIEAFTINGAKLFGHDDELGSIEVGKIADIIAIDQNLLALAQSDDIERIADTQVLLTVFDGRIVYERSANDQ